MISVYKFVSARGAGYARKVRAWTNMVRTQMKKVTAAAASFKVRPLALTALLCALLLLFAGCERHQTLPTPEYPGIEKTEPFVPKDEEELRGAADSVRRYENRYLPFSAEREVGIYVGSDRAILVREVVFGEGNDRVTAFVADVYIESVTELVGYVLRGEDGKPQKGSPADVYEQTGAMLIVNGDYFWARRWGFDMREGKSVKRGEVSGADICTVDRDGIMHVYDGDLFDVDAARKDESLYHVFDFGPSLLNADGSPRNADTEFHITDRYQNWNNYDSSVGFPVPNPRTAIGQCADGHWLLVCVDGRNKGHSRGMTFPELSHLMYEEGAAIAYNLDGGGSECIRFDGVDLNVRCGERDPSDYICILPSPEDR